jgi:hypothetical protein
MNNFYAHTFLPFHFLTPKTQKWEKSGFLMFFESKNITLRSLRFFFPNVMPSTGVQICAKGILKIFNFNRDIAVLG